MIIRENSHKGNPFQQGASLHEVEAAPENTCVHYCRFD